MWSLAINFFPQCLCSYPCLCIRKIWHSKRIPIFKAPLDWLAFPITIGTSVSPAALAVNNISPWFFSPPSQEDFFVLSGKALKKTAWFIDIPYVFFFVPSGQFLHPFIPSSYSSMRNTSTNSQLFQIMPALESFPCNLDPSSIPINLLWCIL